MVGIYLSNDIIQAARGTCSGGRIRVEQVYTSQLPEGCVLGGRVMDSQAASQALKELAADMDIRRQPIRVAVDAGSMGIKLLSLPAVSSMKYMRRLISDSFPEGADAIYDHKTLGRNPDGSINVLACRAEKQLIKGYADAFSSAGLRIGSLEPSVCGLIRLVQLCKMLCTSTFAVICAEGGCISRYIFVDGIYRFGGYDRVLSDRCDSGYLNALAKAAASVQLSGYPVTNLLLCGVSSSELMYVRSTVNDLRIKLAELPELPEISFAGGERVSDYTFVAGTLIK